MPKILLLVGPPGSGKSTMARTIVESTGAAYINQDSQGADHMDVFFDAVIAGKDIIIDRMNFNKQQREKYTGYAKLKNPEYKVQIIVLHQPYQVCLERMRERFGKHETIHEEKHARGALKTFFGKYERPESIEADDITFVYPEGEKPLAVVCDLDGTLCNVEHRRHHVRRTDGQKKDWPAFFRGIPDDAPNYWCVSILANFKRMPPFAGEVKIVFCSGRDTNQKQVTEAWLQKHCPFEYDALYMRDRTDSRQDSIVKEIILDFEILTRFTPYFMIDDRQQVVDMWRRRGFVCLQCDVGDF